MATEERTKELIGQVREALINYDEDVVEELCKTALNEGIDPFRVTMEGIADGMIEVGDLYNKKEYFVPELLLCSDALYAGLNILRPAIKESGRLSEAKGSIVLGVVEGDVHDIGKNLIKMMFDVAGWTVYDLGKDVPIEISRRADETGLRYRGSFGLDDHQHGGHAGDCSQAEKEKPQRPHHAGGCAHNPGTCGNLRCRRLCR